jgi:hypothetical protein
MSFFNEKRTGERPAERDSGPLAQGSAKRLGGRRNLSSKRILRDKERVPDGICPAKVIFAISIGL